MQLSLALDLGRKKARYCCTLSGALSAMSMVRWPACELFREAPKGTLAWRRARPTARRQWGLCQKRNSSMQANVFRFAPKNGHSPMQSACPFRAHGDIARQLEMKEAAN